ncbi:hypothetical protein DMB95_01195 [Campylobacter sp. MIT 12-8780]|uniref:hypothetical protein n=1 Tax=unclassified Campylobacter TaxID=2593542 RepID=UPI0010F76B0B|nr:MULTISPECIES: hypothetical protein [unclassified Campylobacter]TKX29236.1 hypothetical protein CQA38_03915 [Campylobacter sp. MIT 12-5580]TQR43145.1 hypothetical protein DMB95_01195 [Campylobacter sp. MIT 12-8780]
MNKNKFFRQIHIYVSLFFLPLALMYAITGIAYIFGANQDIGLKEQSFSVKQTLTIGKEKEELLTLLKELKLKIPSHTELKNDKREGGMSMGGVHYSVNIKQESDQVIITTKERSLLGDMIMLHKDKGKWYFAVLSVGFGLALITLYISGLMITLVAMKKDRQKQLLTLAFAFVITFILAYLSL